MIDQVTFAFDEATGTDRQPRTWSRAPHNPPAGRAGPVPAGQVPLPPQLLVAGYERGHLVAHGTRGGLDPNVFAQAGHINQGRSPQGRRYRRLERVAAAPRQPPGAPAHLRRRQHHPDLTELTVLVDGTVQQGTFDNRPGSWLPDAGVLRRGNAFHKPVQCDFVAGLLGADARPAQAITLVNHRGGRVDLLVIPNAAHGTAVIVEIKSTDWDAPPTGSAA